MRVSAPYWNMWASWTASVSVQHFAWAALLAHSETAAYATAVHAVIGPRWFGVLLLTAAPVGALAGLWHDRYGPTMWGLVVSLPQQALLVMSAIGSGTAILSAQYADGVPRPPAFIAADQLPVLLVLAFHSCALVCFHGQHLLHSTFGGWMNDD